MSSSSLHLLDRRYRITAALPGNPGERHFAAWHVELDIPVRIISVRLSERYNALPNRRLDLFWRRATAAVALRHPGMVRIRDCFRQGDAYTLVLDWTSHDTLAARVAADGPLPLREVLALGLHLCAALGAAAQHAPDLLPLGTITPETLSRLPSGHYQLTDLGIRGWAGEHQRLAILGEPLYSAPERRAGNAGDMRADIYSLAAVLYLALTGEPPASPGYARKLLSELAPRVPAVMRDTIERGLRDDPAERYPTPESFGAALGSASRLALSCLVTATAPSRSLEPSPAAVLPADSFVDSSTEQTMRHSHLRLSTEADGIPSVLHWPQMWVQELSRVAARKPLLRTGERALAALSSALHPGA